MLSILDTIIRRTFGRGRPHSGNRRDRTASLSDVIVPGARWKHLEIISILGKGGFGTAFKAFDSQLNRMVALKFLESEDAIHEGRILACLNESNIVKVHSLEESEGTTALCLELVDGTNLEEFREQQQKLTVRHASLLAIQICEALAALHRRDLLHRDLKPANVVLSGGDRIVLIDLGLGSTWTKAEAEIAGTLPYMAPEILEGIPATPQSDLYSLGILIFYLVSGGFPVTGQSVEGFRDAHRRRERIHLSDKGSFPRSFIEIVERAIAPDPRHRFRTAGHMLAALQDLIVRQPKREFPWKTVGIGLCGGVCPIVWKPANLCVGRDWPIHPLSLRTDEYLLTHGMGAKTEPWVFGQSCLASRVNPLLPIGVLTPQNPPFLRMARG